MYFTGAPERRAPAFYDVRLFQRAWFIPAVAALLGRAEANVTSRHHQAIKALAPGLQAMACSPDGLVEAVWMPDKRFVWGVQWHPEHTCKTSEDSRRLFAAFVEQCV